MSTPASSHQLPSSDERKTHLQQLGERREDEQHHRRLERVADEGEELAAATTPRSTYPYDRKSPLPRPNRR